jgi:hypothetical protein
MRSVIYGCLSFLVMLFVVSGAEPEDTGPPVPKFMVMSVALIGKGEEAHELQVDNKVAFRGRQIAKAPEHFRARIEGSERLVVLYSGVFLEEEGLRVLEAIANIRSDAKKRGDFVDISGIDPDDHLQVVFFSAGDKGNEPRWTIGDKEHREVEAVVRELAGTKSKRIALIGDVPKELLEDFKKSMEKAEVKMVPSSDKPVQSSEFE